MFYQILVMISEYFSVHLMAYWHLLGSFYSAARDIFPQIGNPKIALINSL